MVFSSSSTDENEIKDKNPACITTFYSKKIDNCDLTREYAIVGLIHRDYYSKKSKIDLGFALFTFTTTNMVFVPHHHPTCDITMTKGL